MNMEILEIAGRRCHLCQHGNPQCLLVQPLGGHEQETLAAEAEAVAAEASVPFGLASFEISDWQRELMPWGYQGREGARETLRYILEELLPALTLRFGKLPVVIGGYSLAGLFALWAACETNDFIGVAAASPSVWIAGWPEYAETHPIQARQVYLSLGKREEHTRNREFAQVGNRIRGEYALLQQQLGESQCTLEWNPGGHFADNERRLARAFSWNLNIA